MKLVVPLQHYDEAGRIKPPAMFWVILLYLARSYLVFVGSLSFRQDSSALLSLFYPRHEDLYLGLFVGLPAVLLFLLTGFRQKIWPSVFRRVFYLTHFFLFMALTMDLTFQLLASYQQQWRFAWVPAISILLSLVLMGYTYRSQHIREMFKDWQKAV